MKNNYNIMPTRENVSLAMNGPVPELKIINLQVDELVSEIKENLRLSCNGNNNTIKSVSRNKSSRASPYKLPSKSGCKCGRLGCLECPRMPRSRKLTEPDPETPYELLQKFLRDGNLIQEAVRRITLGLDTKPRSFYESDGDDESFSPENVLVFPKQCVPKAPCAPEAPCGPGVPCARDGPKIE